MIRMAGRGGCDGAAMGRLWWWTAEEGSRRTASQPPEQGRAWLAQAQQRAAAQLHQLAEECRREGRADAADLMMTHALLLTDEDYVAAIHAALEDGCGIETAVQQTGDAFAAQLAALQDASMRARAGDIRDVTRRLIMALQGREEPQWPAEPFILAGEELPPSVCIRLREAPLMGIALAAGSDRGHTAILARAMGIPAVFGLGAALDASCDGRLAILDGALCELVMDPNGAAQAAFRTTRRAHQAQRSRAEAVRGLPDETADGRRLEILCSVSAAQDGPLALENDGRGVGLLRSELFFLADAVPPDEKRQLMAYREVIEALAGRRVVIRLMDLGSDKQAAWLPQLPEANPALGLRGVRLCLLHPEMLRAQLRAICRASAAGQVALLLPMVTTVDEVRAVRRMLTQVQTELAQEGQAFDPAMAVGVMLETPAAALTVAELAAEADFFSLGTNDLTQYILACDRQSPCADVQMDARHPAVLKVLRMAAEAAHAAGKRIGVCGEMGADAAMLPFFLEIGVDEVTVPAAAVLPLRAALREIGE